jgi:hypothetical protein
MYSQRGREVSVKIWRRKRERSRGAGSYASAAAQMPVESYPDLESLIVKE